MRNLWNIRHFLISSLSIMITMTALSIVQAQTTFSKYMGGSLSDNLHSVVQTTDMGYIAVGETETSTGKDLLIIKFDTSGTIVWSRTYGGVLDDRAVAVAPTTDGGFIVGGNTESFGSGYRDFLVIKFN